jgi:hypothetical protein
MIAGITYIPVETKALPCKRGIGPCRLLGGSLGLLADWQPWFRPDPLNYGSQVCTQTHTT